MDAPQRLIINQQGASSLDAYLEYTNIVGDDDGGKLMSEVKQLFLLEFSFHPDTPSTSTSSIGGIPSI